MISNSHETLHNSVVDVTMNIRVISTYKLRTLQTSGSIKCRKLRPLNNYDVNNEVNNMRN